MVATKAQTLAIAGWDARRNDVDGVELEPDALERAAARIGAAQREPATTESITRGATRSHAPATTGSIPKRFRPGGIARDSPLERTRSSVKDPTDPRIGKWAVVVLEEDAAAAIEAFGPLIARRVEQKVAFDAHVNAGGRPGVIRFARPRSDSPERWLERATESAGGKLPYYLLFAGGPDRFPFDVQARFDREHATGRVDLGDTPGGPLSWARCAEYADKVITFEKGGLPVEPRALVFSFATDPATDRSHAELALPVFEALEKGQITSAPGVVLRPPESLFGDAATTGNLIRTLSSSRPAVVLTASHGLEFPADHDDWGALTDRSFVGARGGQPLSAARALSAGDPSAPVPASFAPGAVMLAFACFSAGVPKTSDIAFLDGRPAELAPGAFVPALPRALLAAKNGPIAFVGHVDRATSESFGWGTEGPAAFLDFVEWTTGGHGTLGQAMRTMRESVAAASLDLADALTPVQAGKRRGTPERILRTWVRYHDMRGYLLLGDPVIRPRDGFGVPG